MRSNSNADEFWSCGVLCSCYPVHIEKCALLCVQDTLLDYTQSEAQLRTARDSKQLKLASELFAHFCARLFCEGLTRVGSHWQHLAGHLTTDAVLASSAHVMQSAIDYMNEKWGSAAGYAKAIGITSSEISFIRLNLMKEAAPRDLMSRLAWTRRPTNDS